MGQWRNFQSSFENAPQSALTLSARSAWLSMAQFWLQLAQTAEQEDGKPPNSASSTPPDHQPRDP
jgi:hypothetical protein